MLNVKKLEQAIKDFKPFESTIQESLRRVTDIRQNFNTNKQFVYVDTTPQLAQQDLAAFEKLVTALREAQI